MASKKKPKPFDALADRTKRGMNQSEYWSAVGARQSTGSRYESGRTPPLATRALLRMIYGGVDDPVRAVDMERAV